MSTTPIDVARRVLADRPSLPGDPAEWGRRMGLTPGQALKLIREEERKRK